MTIKEAINRFAQENPSIKITPEQMIAELSRLDTLVKLNIIDSHEGGGGEFNGYDSDTDVDTELLIEKPYDDIYIDWLSIKNEFLLKDYKRYNSIAEVYGMKYKEYEAYYNRTHMPIQKQRIYY